MLNLERLEILLNARLPSVSSYLFEEIDSTNAFLKTVAKQNLVESVCVANFQAAGYGQRGRNWLSNGDSWTFSLLVKVGRPVHKLAGIAQYIALETALFLETEISGKLFLKWPNDLFCSEGKVGGILTEVVSYSEGNCWLVIGIGLNFSEQNLSLKTTVDAGDSSALSYPVGFLILKNDLEDEVVLAGLLQHLSACVGGYADENSSWIRRFKKLDYFSVDQKVIVYDSGQSKIGLYKGLADNGEVLVEIDGEIMNYQSGMTSIRAIEKEL
ncbi:MULTISPECIES: biotin--[acetyl-CoA-carboxylase] ligase [Thiomicrorhabdus]|uniref:Biotin--[acetyl-CoA-carboxylase] ligase n=1 Tax=Thiomicrorhabdus heinhorstiae TaxID=2748010 RepID=A0ABS0BWY4_9GAMM|nr:MULTISPECIES: biotin--[acetyl-CoA-carboxylase] ligase [Thiomicrorhabdus]MBF6057575.1 biotin--[acetyl-CoA-carboxylase] ligase [Thiomicrorhabdus heinhorstiae]